MVNAYNKRSPLSPVQASGMEHESFKSGIKGLLVTGKSPDIFSYWAGAKTQAMIDDGYIASIDDVWNEAGLDAVFPPSIAAMCTYGGKKYALPITQHLIGFFYDAKKFASMGLKPPKTWDEFLLVCEQLRKAGVVPIALGNKELWPAQFWFDYLLIRTAGPEYRDNLMHGKASYTDKQVLRAFSLWQTLIDNHYFSDTTDTNDWAGAAREVHDGKAAMTLMGTWIMGFYEDQLGWKEMEDYNFFVFPQIDDGVPQVAIGPIDVLVATRGNGEQSVKEVLKYFAETELQQVMSQGSGALAPSRLVPMSFYSPLKQQIALQAQKAEGWRLAFDLSVPPAAVDAGLGVFAAFMHHNQKLGLLMKSLQQRVETVYAPR